MTTSGLHEHAERMAHEVIQPGRYSCGDHARVLARALLAALAELEQAREAITGYVAAERAEADYAAAYDAGIEGLWPEAGLRLKAELQAAYEKLAALAGSAASNKAINTCDECAKHNVGPCPHAGSGAATTGGNE